MKIDSFGIMSIWGGMNLGISHSSTQKKVHIGKRDFTKYRTEIDEFNLKSLQSIGFVGMVAGIILTLFSIPPIHILKLFPAYLAVAILFTGTYILARTVLVNHREWVLPLFYFFVYFGIVIGNCYGNFVG